MTGRLHEKQVMNWETDLRVGPEKDQNQTLFLGQNVSYILLWLSIRGNQHKQNITPMAV
jgi:hypothetical protein